jgi:hypothetical protein
MNACSKIVLERVADRRMHKAKHARRWQMSVTYSFVRARQLDGTLSEGPKVGTYLITAERVYAGWGRVSEKRCPYPKRGAPWPPVVPDALDGVAKFNRAYLHYRVRGLDDLKRSLMNLHSPLNFPLISIPIHPGWRAPDNGLIQIPSVFPIPTAYHAVPIVGYDDNTQLLKLLNNWGPQWGASGFGFLPYSYFDNFCNDAWSRLWAPELMLSQRKYIEHQFIVAPGALPNPLGNLSYVINIWQPHSDVRVGWCCATIRDSWFEIEDFFIRPDYQNDDRHLISLVAETFRCPIHQQLPVRFWIPDADTHFTGCNFSVINKLIRQLGLRVRPSGVKWAPYRAEMPIPMRSLPSGITPAWPNVLALGHRDTKLKRHG